jgi:hypothetical protein
LEFVQDTKTFLQTEFRAWTQPASDGESEDPFGQPGVLEAIFHPPGLILGEQDIQLQPKWPVGEESDSFERLLVERYGMLSNRRPSTTLDARTLSIAIGEIRDVATALEMDSDDVDKRFRNWIFALKIPRAPTRPDQYWRNVHTQVLDWHKLARIIVRYASMRTNEAEVEQLPSEQPDIQ